MTAGGRLSLLLTFTRREHAITERGGKEMLLSVMRQSEYCESFEEWRTWAVGGHASTCCSAEVVDGWHGAVEATSGGCERSLLFWWRWCGEGKEQQAQAHRDPLALYRDHCGQTRRWSENPNGDLSAPLRTQKRLFSSTSEQK